ncbi:MAG: hypothetical protein GY832_25040 [Chloroflexi bacterium]|nr:hypothetical protein [Chloroflexota bacterium]
MSKSNSIENLCSAPVPNFPDYRVDTNGGVWSYKFGKCRLLKPVLNNRGYHIVGLCRDGKRHIQRVHALVLMTFVSPRPEGEEACHWNGCQTDNRLVNLRWDTHKNNYADAVRHGTSHIGVGSPPGEAHSTAKLTEADVYEIRRRHAAGGITQAALASEYPVSRKQIANIIHRKRWSHIP